MDAGVSGTAVVIKRSLPSLYLRVVSPLGKALESAWVAGEVHGDTRPANLAPHRTGRLLAFSHLQDGCGLGERRRVRGCLAAPPIPPGEFVRSRHRVAARNGHKEDARSLVTSESSCGRWRSQMSQTSASSTTSYPCIKILRNAMMRT